MKPPIKTKLLLVLMTSIYSSFAQPFITTWTTTDGQVVIPTNGSWPTYDYTVYWENTTNASDNGTLTNQAGDAVLDGLTNGAIYRVEITGDFPRIYLNNGTEKDKLLSVEQWGSIIWYTFENAFYGCTQLRINATDAPDLSAYTDISMFRMFSGATAMNDPINHWNVDNVISFSHLFEGASSFNQPLNNWNPPGLTGIKLMFKDAAAFNQPVNHFDVDQVTDFAGTFEGATAFNQPVDDWDVGLGQNFGNMFYGASAFNRSLGDWDISSATTMDWMLFNSGLSSVNFDKTIIGWNSLDGEETRIPSSIALYANLNFCTVQSEIYNLSRSYSWDIQNTNENCDDTFFITTWKSDNTGASNSDQITIPTIAGYTYDIYWEELGNPDLNGSINGVDGSYTIDFGQVGTYEVRISGDFPRIWFNNGGDKDKLLTVEQWGAIEWLTMESAFEGCSNLTIPASDAPDLSQVYDMSSMFQNATALNSPLDHWDVSNVTNMNSMFSGASSFDQPLSSWDISSVSIIYNLFLNASAFNQDLNAWDVHGITNLQGMFSGASSFNQDLPDWDVSEALYLTEMFRGATDFNGDISTWDTGKVLWMYGMFHTASDFNGDITGWNTGQVQYMYNMFYNASSFNQNIGGWNVEEVTNMNTMFFGASAFDQDLSGWKVSKVGNFSTMFYNASSFDQSLASWDIGSATSMFNMLSNSGLSEANYDATLQGWASLVEGETAIPTEVSLGANGLTYCAGTSARSSLVNAYDWTIAGDITSCPVLNLVSTNPQSNAQSISIDANIVIQFDSNIDEATVAASSILVLGDRTGIVEGVFSGYGTTELTFNPTSDFKAGETIQVSITKDLVSEDGANLDDDHFLSFVVESSEAPSDPPLFEQATIYSDGTNTGVDRVVAMDVDMDGHVDVAAIYDGVDSGVAWYHNDGNQEFTREVVATPTMTEAQSAHLSDYDLDGDIDLFNIYNGRIDTQVNDGAEEFTVLEPYISQTGAGHGITDLRLADIDGDGDLDIAAPWGSNFYNFHRITWYERTDEGTYVTDYFDAEMVIPSGIELVDMDKDGDVDIAAGGYEAEYAWYENDGNQNFTNHTFSSAMTSQYGGFAVGDFDGDGHMDMALNTTTETSWFENDGTGNFSENPMSTSIGGKDLQAADIDGDGDMDLVAGYNSELRFWENDGDGNFTLRATTAASTTIEDIFVVDLDSDGDLDVVAGGRLTKIVWFENTSSLIGGVQPNDYHALEALYNSTGGANWTDNTNWLSGNVEDWFGITVVGTRVVSVELVANNLIGTIPEELTDLTEVTDFDFAENSLIGAPDLSSLTNLSSLYLDDNNLEFDDLEPNVGISGITYIPQATLDGPNDMTLTEGQALDVMVLVGGTNNVYQWVKDEADLVGQDSDNLVIASVDSEDAGTYFLRITNSVVDDLTLSTESFEVTVNPAPINVTANASSTSICLGDEVILTGSGASDYSWDNNVEDGVAFAPTQTLEYTVTGTSGEATGNASVTITVVDVPKPTITVQTGVGNLVQLASSSAEGNQWYRAGQLLEGETKQVLLLPRSANAVDNYSVTVTQEGCEASSDSFDFFVLNSDVLSQHTEVWPNPTKQVIHLRLGAHSSLPELVRIIGLDGQVVRHEVVQWYERTAVINIDKLNSGVYFVSLDGHATPYKFIKK